MSSAPAVSRREVVARLAGAQKSSRGAAAYSRWVNRPLGRQLAAVAYLSGLTPNQVSGISALFTFPAIAVVALVRPNWIVAMCVVLALLLGYALDSADGQVARLRGGGSPAGEWLDHVLDCLKISSLHTAIAIAWFRYFSFASDAMLLVPLAFAVVSTVFFFSMILTDMLRRVQRLSIGETGLTTASVTPDEHAPILRSLIVLPNDYGLLCLTFILFPLHRSFATGYAILFASNTLFLIVGCVRWFREIEALPFRAASGTTGGK